MILFPPFRLDPTNVQLWRDTQVIHLKPKSFAVLHYLLQRPGRLVTREDLLAAIWPDTIVLGDEAVNSCIKDIRKKLGDDVKTPRFIETVPKRGYRFIGSIVHQSASPVTFLPSHRTEGAQAQSGIEPSIYDGQPDLRAASPFFIAGPSLTQPRHFFGRERELTRLFNLWKRLPLQNAAIIGPGRSGKTSLLTYLCRITTTPASQLRAGQRTDWLPSPERYRWIYVDFQDPRVGSREGLLRRLLVSMGLEVPTPCDLERFLDVAATQLHTPTVILLDRIDLALQRYAELDNVFWEALRALATTQVEGHVAFVLAARERPEQIAQRCGIGSPFFNIFGYTAMLGPLTEPEARALIASTPCAFPAADVDWILAHSGCWPLLLQILCQERLAALEEGDHSPAWQAEGVRQLTSFRSLLESA